MATAMMTSTWKDDVKRFYFFSFLVSYQIIANLRFSRIFLSVSCFVGNHSKPKRCASYVHLFNCILVSSLFLHFHKLRKNNNLKRTFHGTLSMARSLSRGGSGLFFFNKK